MYTLPDVWQLKFSFTDEVFSIWLVGVLIFGADRQIKEMPVRTNSSHSCSYLCFWCMMIYDLVNSHVPSIIMNSKLQRLY